MLKYSNFIFSVLITFLVIHISCEKEGSDGCKLLGYGAEFDNRYQYTFDYHSNKVISKKEYGLILKPSPYLNDFTLSDTAINTEEVIYQNGLVKKINKYSYGELLEHDEFEYDRGNIIRKCTYDDYHYDKPTLTRTQEYKYKNGLLSEISYYIHLTTPESTYISDTLYKYFYFDNSGNLIKTVQVEYITDAHDSIDARYTIEEFSEYDNMVNPFFKMPFQNLFYPCVKRGNGHYIIDPSDGYSEYTVLSGNNFGRYKVTTSVRGEICGTIKLEQSFHYNDKGYPVIGKYLCY